MVAGRQAGRSHFFLAPGGASAVFALWYCQQIPFDQMSNEEFDVIDDDNDGEW
jgi:hypothetical protein